MGNRIFDTAHFAIKLKFIVNGFFLRSTHDKFTFEIADLSAADEPHCQIDITHDYKTVKLPFKTAGYKSIEECVYMCHVFINSEYALNNIRYEDEQ